MLLLPCSSAPVAGRKASKQTTSSGSSLLSVDMGLSITPYQLRTMHIPTNADLHQRPRRLHMRAPLRPLITTTAAASYPFSSPLEINAHGVRAARNDYSQEERDARLRRASLLSSPSLVPVEEVRRVNLEFDDDWTMPSAGVVGRPLLNRRRSHAK